MATFLTLDEAKQELRITDTAHDADVQAKLDEAEAAIIGYLAAQFDAAWTAETVPKEVRIAIKLKLNELYDYGRGDPTKNAATAEAIRRTLTPLRDQALGVGTSTP